jgi:CMP-N-acetylneuraminic acid synthetase
MRIENGVLRPFLPDGSRVTRRQDARPAYRREGTAYAFRRETLTRFGNIYGEDCRPILMEPADSLSIDSRADWEEAERRLGART